MYYYYYYYISGCFIPFHILSGCFIPFHTFFRLFEKKAVTLKHPENEPKILRSSFVRKNDTLKAFEKNELVRKSCVKMHKNIYIACGLNTKPGRGMPDV